MDCCQASVPLVLEVWEVPQFRVSEANSMHLDCPQRPNCLFHWAAHPMLRLPRQDWAQTVDSLESACSRVDRVSPNWAFQLELQPVRRNWELGSAVQIDWRQFRLGHPMRHLAAVDPSLHHLVRSSLLEARYPNWDRPRHLRLHLVRALLAQASATDRLPVHQVIHLPAVHPSWKLLVLGLSACPNCLPGSGLLRQSRWDPASAVAFAACHPAFALTVQKA